MTERQFRQCFDQKVDDFETYDLFVDVTTAWEVLMKKYYKQHFNHLSINRFPSVESTEEGMDPTFTVFYNSDYGIVGKLYYSLPRNPASYQKEIQFLEEMSSGVPLTDSQNSKRSPEIEDLVILVHASQSQTAAHRLQDSISDGTANFEGNVVLLQYDFLDEDSNPKYRFRRETTIDQNFRDFVSPDELQFNRRLSMEGDGFEAIISPVSDFPESKTTGVICNEPPSNLYLACYLWQHVFYTYLDDGQRKEWSKNNPRKILEFDITVSDLTTRLNQDFIPSGSLTELQVDSTLEYICVAGAGEVIGKDKYRIKYRNLQDKDREYKEVVSDRKERGNIPGLLAEWHCENQVEMSSSEISEFIKADDIDTADLDGLDEAQLHEF